MTSIQQIVKSIIDNNQHNGQNQHNQHNQHNGQKVALVLDVSGSTGTKFKETMTVLEKEIECMSTFILSNKQNVYQLYSFESRLYEHGNVNILYDEDFVSLPDFRPLGGTLTHLALDAICQNLNNFKPDIVKVFTDGQTNSYKNQFDKSMSTFLKHNIKFEITAVTCSNLNMETITKNEEMRIPGMDLVNMLGNSIDSLSIFNLFHDNDPFNGIVNTSTDKNSLKFLGNKLNDIIPVFLNKLLVAVNENKKIINWGTNQIDLKKMLTEIGKLLSIFFVEMPVFHPLVLKIVDVMSKATGLTNERILKILEYGFTCSKQNKPIVLTNFEEHVKDSVNKHNEFADAITELNLKGTTLGSNKRITIPYGNNNVCILDNGSVTLPLTMPQSSYPNSLDQRGNAYFGLNVNPQAIRIGLRTHCGNIGFQGARYSNAVPFFVLCQMSLMFIKGIDLNSEHMKALRELAIYQTSLEVMVAKNKYDGKGCYNYWKTGKLIPIHYEKQVTHTSIYTDKLVNPLRLSEPIWWALMMSMLGLFEEQKNVYMDSVNALGINCNLESFLNYVRHTYSNDVGGNIVCETFPEVQKSLFTLDHFDETDEIYVLKDHSSNGDQVNCCTKTWYSAEELEYLKKNGCVWCHYMPLSTDFEKIVKKNIDKSIEIAMLKSSKLTFANVKELDIANKLNISDGSKIRINMCGITGSGKTTFTEKLEQMLKNNNCDVLIVNSDSLSKRGIKGKEMQKTIFNNIRNFEKNIGQKKKKVVIMDLCNENGVTDNSFGLNFSEYNDVTFFPNFNKEQFDDYQAWCLNNVINRPIHTNDTNYWLNPVSAGVETCIKVHNMKARGIANIVGVQYNDINMKLTMTQLKNLISEKSQRYANYLKTRNFEEEISNFLTDLKLLNVIPENQNKVQV